MFTGNAANYDGNIADGDAEEVDLSEDHGRGRGNPAITTQTLETAVARLVERVLVIEDNPLTLLTLKERLTQAGYKVDTATDTYNGGGQIIAAFEVGRPYHAIISDDQTPAQDSGSTLLTVLRSEFDMKSPYMIVMSGTLSQDPSAIAELKQNRIDFQGKDERGFYDLMLRHIHVDAESYLEAQRRTAESRTEPTETTTSRYTQQPTQPAMR